jgi:ribosomal protein RSM22 (predicted rRNA methylase)
VKLGRASLTWQKTFQDNDKIRRTDGRDVLALSAFSLSSLPTALARKTLVKEIWSSGAHTIVLIDHNTTAGFEAIAEAREYLLEVGRKEIADPETDDWDVRGSHVVAPCPHDGVCPLRHPGSSRLVCGFSQRLQRPSFVRLTKHSGVGHEDIGYSYVVVQRGPRPQFAGTKAGRIGEVGQRAIDKDNLTRVPMKELILHEEHDESSSAVGNTTVHEPIKTTESSHILASHVGLQHALKLEAYSWPRLVFPPLKRSGHVILDSCTSQGKIMRLTIPKSQGKQEYYDARKSSWGDLFPHEPKNTPQERYQPTRAKQQGGTTATQGADIGKRRVSDSARTSYSELSKDLKEKQKKTRRDRIRAQED